ncbi:MAG TPA: hypothetical protein VFM14_13325 [Gemmatimonadales bacterium]|nr:hypothetical protein [Gemmatimonadales bacterium]
MNPLPESGKHGVVIGLLAAAASAWSPGAGWAQAVTLPLRGEGELDLPSGIHSVARGSVLLRAADSAVRVTFIDAGAPRVVFTGRWRMADHRSALVQVDSVMETMRAGGTGAIRFRPDGSVDEIDVRGVADGEAFTVRFDNSTTVGIARADSAVETGALSPPARAGDWPWATRWAVVDAVRRGVGVLKHADGRDVRFTRARLTLGANEEFMLVLDGKRRVEFVGVWRGDLGSEPVRLQLREASDQAVGGVGRAWLAGREPEREWFFTRVELDGWDDDSGDAFTLSFEADGR